MGLFSTLRGEKQEPTTGKDTDFSVASIGAVGVVSRIKSEFFVQKKPYVDVRADANEG